MLFVALLWLHASKTLLDGGFVAQELSPSNLPCLVWVSTRTWQLACSSRLWQCSRWAQQPLYYPMTASLGTVTMSCCDTNLSHRSLLMTCILMLVICLIAANAAAVPAADADDHAAAAACTAGAHASAAQSSSSSSTTVSGAGMQHCNSPVCCYHKSMLVCNSCVGAAASWKPWLASASTSLYTTCGTGSCCSNVAQLTLCASTVKHSDVRP